MQRDVYTTQQADGSFVTSTTRPGMQRGDVYTTQQPDGTYVTTTTRTKTKYKEDEVYGCGRGLLNTAYLLSIPGILRMVEVFLCLVLICLVISVFGPGPFRGVLFGQTILLLTAGVALCLSFIFLVVYVLALDQTHLDFYPWTTSNILFSSIVSVFFLVLAVVEVYYSTGSWSNNCNEIGSDGIIHNGCRIVIEWAFASFVAFILAIVYALSAFCAYRARKNQPYPDDFQ